MARSEVEPSFAVITMRERVEIVSAFILFRAAYTIADASCAYIKETPADKKHIVKIIFFILFSLRK
jgi:hypothetical protein